MRAALQIGFAGIALAIVLYGSLALGVARMGV